MHACVCLKLISGAVAHEMCCTSDAGLFDRLIMQRQQEGSSLLAKHLLPAQENVQQPPILPGGPALLPLLLGKNPTTAADEQPEQLPYAVAMHLRERRTALEHMQQQKDAQRNMGEKQKQNEPELGQVHAHDVFASAAAAGTGPAALSEPAVVQHAEQHNQQPSTLQPAARASGIFAQARRDKRHHTAGTQVLAGTQPAKEQVGCAAPINYLVVWLRLADAGVGNCCQYTRTYMTCRLEGTSTSSSSCDASHLTNL